MKLYENETIDFVVNELELHIKRDNQGMFIDFYKHIADKDITDEHNFDDDFIKSVYIELK